MDLSKIKLSYNIMFALLMSAKKLCKSKNEPECFKEFLNLVFGREINYFVGNTLKTYTISYKKGILENRDLSENSNFEEHFKKGKGLLLENTAAFLNSILTNDEAKLWYAKALLFIVTNDQSISDDQVFFAANYDCYKVTKAELSDPKYKNIFLPSLFLGLLAYLDENKVANFAGRTTFEYLYNGRDSSQGFMLNSTLSQAAERDIRISMETKKGYNEPVFYSVDSSIDPEEFTEATGGKDFEYLNRAYAEYNKIKTLLYSAVEHKFYDFYVCNELREQSHFKDFGSTFSSINFLPPPIIDKNGFRKPNDFFTRNSKLIITSGGGMGKSMMMRHILLSTIRVFRNCRYIPIMVNARDYDFVGTLDSLFYKAYTNLGGIETESEFNNHIKAGGFIFLIDGLDEVKERRYNEFETLLNEFTLRNPKNCIIATARPYSSFLSLKNFKNHELEPLSKEQALELVERLDFKEDVPQIKENFKSLLKEGLYDQYKGFASNPLLLTLMLMTFGNKLEIPNSMPEFYASAYEVLTYKHDHEKGLHRELELKINLDQFKKIFTEFCFESYMSGQFSFSKDGMILNYEVLESTNEYGVQNEGSKFVNDVTSSVCLMVEDSGYYDFIHRSFQEYFAAKYIADSSEDDLKNFGEECVVSSDFIEGDNVFSMLYQMIPQKIEKYVIMPYLESRIAGLDFEEFMLRYVKEIFCTYDPDLTYSVMVVKPSNDWLINYISNFVIGNASFVEINGSLISKCKELDVFCKIEDRDKGSREEKCKLSNLPSIKNLKSIDINLNFKEIIEHKEQYPNAYEQFITEKSPYYNFYLELNKYYRKLVEVNSRKRTSIAEKFKQARKKRK